MLPGIGTPEGRIPAEVSSFSVRSEQKLFWRHSQSGIALRSRGRPRTPPKWTPQDCPPAAGRNCLAVAEWTPFLERWSQRSPAAQASIADRKLWSALRRNGSELCTVLACCSSSSPQELERPREACRLSSDKTRHRASRRQFPQGYRGRSGRRGRVGSMGFVIRSEKAR
jgi:hypothetical protein